MARRVPEQGGANPEIQPSAEGIPGGASGIIADAAANIVNPAQPVAQAEIPADAPVVEVKRYRVTNEPPAGKTGFPVILDSCLTHFPKGKIVTDQTYDVQKLKEQGLLLEELA